MTIKQWAAIVVGAILALVVAFTAGRYAAPAKIVEKEKVVEVEKKVEVVSQKAIDEAVTKAEAEWKKNEKIRTVERIIYKEGKIVEKIVYRDRETNSGGSSSSSSSSTSESNTNSTTTQENTKVTEKEKKQEAQTDRWRLSLSASTKWNEVPTIPGLKYEGRVEYRLVGGLWVGVTAMPQLQLAGATLALQF